MNDLQVIKEADEVFKGNIARLINGVLAFAIMMDATDKQYDDIELILASLSQTCFEYGMYKQEKEDLKCMS
ncbi:hypothetical protein [Erysipelothrix aquatica]|uniref:hypothetical protein n=1 Tax=Erysipelothrix aquatica TaxID=2683714 RepID=UPI00135BDAE5|nr:hypothetical protein [Erysipelothrix aquatica]